MTKKKYSLYLALGLIIFSIVTLIMSINLTYTYINTKNITIENMKQNSRETILSLNDSLKTLIPAYAINEYDNLITNKINRGDIFAIVVEDYNMGKIFGTASYIRGKIKINNEHIIKYDPNNNTHNEYLENCFYSDKFDILSNEDEKLGRITIYISDEKLENDLKEIILESVKNTIVLSLLLTLFLFIAIRIFILKPIYDIILSIRKGDEEGIPLKPISNNSITEINNLSTSINNMINSIKLSRRKLKSEQNKFEYLLQLSPIAVRITKNKGKDVTFANNAYSKLLHVSNYETLNKNPRDYYFDKQEYDDIVSIIENGESIYNKLIKLKINNTTVWALASYMNIDFDGEDAIIGWFYDVTNEKINEEKLFEALELQTTIFDNSGYLIIRTDENGIIKQINKEAQEVLEYEAKELVDIYTVEKIHLKSEVEQRAKELSFELKKDVKVGFNTFTEKAKINLKDEREWTYLSKSGKHIPILLSITCLRTKENLIYGYLGISRDITQNKVLESQTKLASMGEMIGNIAHQWRQPLSVISTIASGIKVKCEFDYLDEVELIQQMDGITLQAQYLSKTIDDFRDFIKNNNDKEEILISKIIEKTMSILNSTLINNNIKVIIDIKDDISIYAFENQLIQAIINIINNSKDAILETIEKDKDRYIFIETRKKENTLLLNIKDNGGGINKNVIEKIFDPYFTTKHQSIGTGIGLSMTYKIITEHHNASIQVTNEEYIYENKKSIGANFEIIFKL